MSMHFPKMTVVTVTTVVGGNVVEKDGILRRGEAGGMAPDLDCTRLNVEEHLGRTVACPGANHPTRVSACQFREPYLDGSA